MTSIDYAWVITTDHIENRKENNRSGPAGIEPWHIKVVLDKGTVFKMSDDDDNLYYTGKIYWWGDRGGTGFEPLDDFGIPNAGCTYIQYYENNEWRTL